LLSTRLQPEVDGIKAHQWLTTLNGLTGINQTLKHLACHPKTQVALDAGSHDSRERT
jgi:hypothetical protein